MEYYITGSFKKKPEYKSVGECGPQSYYCLFSDYSVGCPYQRALTAVSPLGHSVALHWVRT